MYCAWIWTPHLKLMKIYPTFCTSSLHVISENGKDLREKRFDHRTSGIFIKPKYPMNALRSSFSIFECSNSFVNQTKVLEWLIWREYKTNTDDQLVIIAIQNWHFYMEIVCCQALPYRWVKQTLCEVTSIWLNYEGLIGDPWESDSDWLSVCCGVERPGHSIVKLSLLHVALVADERLMVI